MANATKTVLPVKADHESTTIKRMITLVKEAQGFNKDEDQDMVADRLKTLLTILKREMP